MRRWNGWGDDATSMDLNDQARAMMTARLGPGRPAPDAVRETLLAKIPASRLPPHPLIQTDPSTRLTMALGESFADWIRKRFGALPPVPDGVAFVELPARFEVLAPDGTVIPRQRGLIRVVSLSTIDPMHMLADVSEDRWASWR